MLQNLRTTATFATLGEGIALAVLYLIDFYGLTEVDRTGMAVVAFLYLGALIVTIVLAALSDRTTEEV